MPEYDIHRIRAILKKVIVIHIILLVFTALLLDGGSAFDKCVRAVLAYWLYVLYYFGVRKGHRRMDKMDMCILKYGTFLFLIGIVVGMRWYYGV